MALTLILNGQTREFAELSQNATLAGVLGVLALKSDRVAVELNGMIAPRETWAACAVQDRDRLEIVHFVGGGTQRGYHR